MRPRRFGVLALLASVGCNSILGNETFQPAAPDASSPDSQSSSDGSKAEGGPRDGGPGARVLASGQPSPMGIAVFGDQVYWVNLSNPSSTGSSGDVRRVSKDGGKVAVLSDNESSPIDVGVDGTGVFWSANTATAMRHQCLVRTIQEAGADGGADGGPACLTTSGLLYLQTVRLSLSPSYVILLTADAVNDPYIGYADQVLRGTDIYYTIKAQNGPALSAAGTDDSIVLGDGTHVDNVVRSRIPFDFASPTKAYTTTVCNGGCSGSGGGGIVDVVVDGNRGLAFWVTSNGAVSSGSFKVPTMGPFLLANVSGTPQRIAIDTSNVYVTTTDGSGGDVYWIARTEGAEPKVLVHQSCPPYGVTSDGDTVYWTCGTGEGQVQSIPARR